MNESAPGQNDNEQAAQQDWNTEHKRNREIRERLRLTVRQPAPPRKMVCLFLRPEQYEELHAISVRTGVSMQKLMREGVDAALFARRRGGSSEKHR